MLLDSNIVVYASKPDGSAYRQWMIPHRIAIASVTYVEVLGYPKLTEAEERLIRRMFAVAHRLPLDDRVLNHAVELRRQRLIKLGDALIAATALAHAIPLVTRNVRDFAWIRDLRVIDPLA